MCLPIQHTLITLSIIYNTSTITKLQLKQLILFIKLMLLTVSKHTSDCVLKIKYNEFIRLNQIFSLQISASVILYLFIKIYQLQEIHIIQMLDIWEFNLKTIMKSFLHTVKISCNLLYINTRHVQQKINNAMMLYFYIPSFK